VTPETSELPIVTERIQLVPLGPALAQPLARFQDLNRKHFRSSGTPLPTGAALFERARQSAEEAERDWRDDRAFRFVLLPKEARPDAELLGHVSFTQIFRGPFQACYLGFGLDEREVGRGLMKEALQHAIRFVFEQKRLHRVMANHMPTNTRSASTLRSLGFVHEGYARDYLFLDGAWRDHILMSLTNPAPIHPSF
jgi:[ribosomal protein S5]-alanine N-acetyltransferase